MVPEFIQNLIANYPEMYDYANALVRVGGGITAIKIISEHLAGTAVPIVEKQFSKHRVESRVQNQVNQIWCGANGYLDDLEPAKDAIIKVLQEESTTYGANLNGIVQELKRLRREDIAKILRHGMGLNGKKMTEVEMERNLDGISAFLNWYDPNNMPKMKFSEHMLNTWYGDVTLGFCIVLFITNSSSVFNALAENGVATGLLSEMTAGRGGDGAELATTFSTHIAASGGTIAKIPFKYLAWALPAIFVGSKIIDWYTAHGKEKILQELLQNWDGEQPTEEERALLVEMIDEYLDTSHNHNNENIDTANLDTDENNQEMENTATELKKMLEEALADNTNLVKIAHVSARLNEFKSKFPYAKIAGLLGAYYLTFEMISGAFGGSKDIQAGKLNAAAELMGQMVSAFASGPLLVGAGTVAAAFSSSSVTTALTVFLVLAGVLTLEQAMWVITGINIGNNLSTFMAAWGIIKQGILSKKSKRAVLRAAFMTLNKNSISAVLFTLMMIFPESRETLMNVVMGLPTFGRENEASAAAWYHTVFNASSFATIPVQRSLIRRQRKNLPNYGPTIGKRLKRNVSNWFGDIGKRRLRTLGIHVPRQPETDPDYLEEKDLLIYASEGEEETIFEPEIPIENDGEDFVLEQQNPGIFDTALDEIQSFEDILLRTQQEHGFDVALAETGTFDDAILEIQNYMIEK